MNFTPLIASPATAGWPIWVLMVALLSFAIAAMSRPKIFRAIRKVTFSSFDRVYNDTDLQWESSLGLRLFCVLTFALSLQILVYTSGPFAFTQYLLILVGVVAWVYLRRGIRYMIERMGKLKNKGFPSIFFTALGLFVCLFLYGANLLYILWDWSTLWLIVSGAAVLMWLGTILIKLYRFFVRGWKSFLALIAYWLIVEAGSVFGLYELIKLI